MRWWSQLRERIESWRFGAIDTHASLGKRGEQFAARFLRRAGYKILAHRESDFAGELDLIVTDAANSQVIFVEVKTLASLKPGHPADRVDEDKQQRITKAALRYLKRHRLLECRCRFDVIAIWWPEGEKEPARLEHYQAAFEASGVNGFFS